MCFSISTCWPVHSEGYGGALPFCKSRHTSQCVSPLSHFTAFPHAETVKELFTHKWINTDCIPAPNWKLQFVPDFLKWVKSVYLFSAPSMAGSLDVRTTTRIEEVSKKSACTETEIIAGGQSFTCLWPKLQMRNKVRYMTAAYVILWGQK